MLITKTVCVITSIHFSFFDTTTSKFTSSWFWFRYHHDAEIIAIIANITNTKAKRPKLIHSGLSTHHHDHAILPVSFKTIKTIVNSPTKPIPPDELGLDELDILFSFMLYHVVTF